jgi:glycosyltransferase involved in cell wall biosynthesis
MKIVQISRSTSSMAPSIDVDGERQGIHDLTEELIRRGHKVFLFAAKGSRTSAKLYEYPSEDSRERLDYIIRNLPKDVDIIHDHDGMVAKTKPPVPTIRSLEERSKSKKQILVYPSKTVLGKKGERKGYFVHPGVRVQDYRFCRRKGPYLLYLGPIAKGKGVHIAIEVARKTGRRLIIAGPISDKKGNKYFRRCITPHLGSNVMYAGIAEGEMKQKLLSEAYCVLFPSTRKEPFVKLLIEALACGTPILGFKKGTVPEVLKGVKELVCKDTKDMVRKVKSGNAFPKPAVCRRYVAEHFSDVHMADGYLKLYRKVIRGKKYKVVRHSQWVKRRRKLLRSK